MVVGRKHGWGRIRCFAALRGCPVCVRGRVHGWDGCAALQLHGFTFGELIPLRFMSAVAYSSLCCPVCVHDLPRIIRSFYDLLCNFPGRFDGLFN